MEEEERKAEEQRLSELLGQAPHMIGTDTWFPGYLKNWLHAYIAERPELAGRSAILVIDTPGSQPSDRTVVMTWGAFVQAIQAALSAGEGTGGDSGEA